MSKSRPRQSMFFSFSAEDITRFSPSPPPVEEPVQIHPIQTEAKSLADSFGKDKLRIEKLIAAHNEAEEKKSSIEGFKEGLILRSALKLVENVQTGLDTIAGLKLNLQDESSLTAVNYQMLYIEKSLTSSQERVGVKHLTPEVRSQLEQWLKTWSVGLIEKSEKEERPSPK